MKYSTFGLRLLSCLRPMRRAFSVIATRGFALTLAFAVAISSLGGVWGTVQAAPLQDNKVELDMVLFVLTGDYGIENGQPTGAGLMKNGNVGPYPEGSCIPASVRVTNHDNQAGDVQLVPVFDHWNGETYGIVGLEALQSSMADVRAMADNLNDFQFIDRSLTTVTSFQTLQGSTVQATVEGPFAGETGSAPVGSTDEFQHFHIRLSELPTEETVEVMFCGQLGQDASEYGHGASMSVRVGHGGAQNTPIRAGELLQLPSLTITKLVQGGSATPSDFQFRINPAINGTSIYSIPQGQSSVTIDNIPLDGTYSITEQGVSGYRFAEGSGTNCVFTNEMASAAVAAGKPAMNAECIFTNASISVPPPTDARLTVVKVVVNDDGGTKAVADFPLFVNASSVTSGETYVLPPGIYDVTEPFDANYVATFTGDCLASGQLDLVAGDDKTCIVTNNDIPRENPVDPFVATTGTLIVVKEVTNDNDGTKVSGDFTLHAQASSTVFTFQGSATGTVLVINAGPYAVTEDEDAGYVASYANCQGTIAAGETKTCTVTNDDRTPGDPLPTTGTLVVIKQVVNDNNGTKRSNDFTLHVTGTHPTLTQFVGSAEGTQVLLGAGAYSVSEDSDSGYAASFSEGCSGTMVVGESRTCTIINNDVAPSGGGGGGGGGNSSSADVTITKTSNSSTIMVGNEFVYTLTVTNIGPDPATGVRVTDVLPTSLAHVSSSATQGTYDVTTGIWTVGSLALNASSLLEIRVRAATSSSAVINTAIASAIEIDPQTANNTASVTVDLTAVPSTGSSGGSGGGTTGGGSGGGSVANGGGIGTTPPVANPGPAPVVLGSQDSNTASTTSLVAFQEPAPIVLGASTEKPVLPRTGVPVGWAALSMLAGLAVLGRKKMKR
jgi:uncharacterized repeat protein (TIGR01451 family)